MVYKNTVPNEDPDPAVFQFDQTLNQLSIYTSDIAKIDSYDLKVSAKYTGVDYSFTDANKLAFTVEIDDPCATQIRTIQPSILPTPLTYFLHDPPL